MRRNDYTFLAGQFRRVWLLPILFLGIGLGANAQQYDSTECFQITKRAYPGQTRAAILNARLYATASTTVEHRVEEIYFSTTGTTDNGDIDSVRIYATGAVDFSDRAFVDADMKVAVVGNSSGSYSIKFIDSLNAGTNNYYIAFDISSSSLAGSDSFDVVLDSVKLNGGMQTPKLATFKFNDPAGKRPVTANGDFCAPTVTFPNSSLSAFLGIVNVKLGDYENSTGDLDRTTLYTDNNQVYYPQISYDVEIKIGSGNDETIKSWIDLNNDGYFAEDEVVIFVARQPQGTTYKGSLTVPCGLAPGKRRMRILSDFWTLSNRESCATNTYGDIEDYIIEIGAEKAPTLSVTYPDTAFTNSITDFTNTSQSFGVTEYEWDFDNDGTSDSFEFNSQHAYASSGKKTFKLTGILKGCNGDLTSTLSNTIEVVAPTKAPTVEFISTTSITKAFRDVSFINFTEDGASTFKWTISPAIIEGVQAFGFEPGSSESSKNPVIQFFIPGIYNVTLEASNSVGKNVLQKTNYITVAPSYNMCGSVTSSTESIGFLFDNGGEDQSYTNFNTCDFTIAPPCAAEVEARINDMDLSIFRTPGGDFIKVYDGTDNTGAPLHDTLGYPDGIQNQSPNNTILVPTQKMVAKSGSMYIEFVADGAFIGDGFEVQWKVKNKVFPASNASIVSSDTTYTGGPVLFASDFSSSFLQSSWDFDGDGVIDGVGEKVSHTYTTAGTYDVLLISDQCGSVDTARKRIVVLQTTAKPTARFSSSKSVTGIAENIDLFDNSTQGPTAWEWRITGPGPVTFVTGNANSQSPRISLGQTGDYDVFLKVTNSLGSDSVTVKGALRAISYCKPNLLQNNKTGVGIARFVLKTLAGKTLIDNTSSEDDLYADYSASIGATIQQGASYIVEFYRLSNLDPIRRALWIDMDQTGDFSRSELVTEEPSNNAGQMIWIDTFTVPTTSRLGDSRLRIGSNTPAARMEGCGPHIFGEFEDYGVKVQPDQSAPVVTLSGGTTTRIEQCNSYVEPGYMAIDNVDGNITSSVTISGTVDDSKPGDYTLSYSVKDAAGNEGNIDRIVTVFADTTKPVATLTGKDSVSFEVFDTYKDDSLTATDACSGIDRVTVNSTLKDDVLGNYTITYTVFDNAGNSVDVQRFINVFDTTKPEITTGADTQFVQVLTPYVEDAQAVDNYDTGIRLRTTGRVKTDRIAEFTLTYAATDNSGNEADMVTKVVQVGDTIAPTISLPFDTIEVEVLKTVRLPRAFGIDNYWSELDFRTMGTVDNAVLGTQTVRYYVLDGSGNSSDTLDLAVIIFDDVAPEIEVVGARDTTICRWSSYTDLGANAIDNYDADGSITVTASPSSVETLIEGTTIITYSAEDASGNKARSKTRIVRVVYCATSIEEHALSKQVSLFPNPANNVLNINIDLPQGTQGTMKLSNTMGQTIKVLQNGSLRNGSMQVDISSLPAGVYFLDLVALDQVMSKKVVIER